MTGCINTNTSVGVNVRVSTVNIYDSMLVQMLASGAPIEIPFKNYFSFTKENANMAQSFNFNVASQSIDRLWATARKSDHAAGDTAKVAVAKPNHPIVAHNCPSMNFAMCNGTGFHFQINNTLYPNWTSTKATDHWQHTKLALGDQGNMLSGSFPQSIQHYKDNFFVYACQLEHHTDGDERFVSGIDTRGAAASCYFNSVSDGGAAVANQTLVFAECTSSLKIYANKVLEVVQ